MNESGEESQLVSTIETAPSAQAGSLLRAAREAQGLHIGALAVALKVPVKKLEALEAGRYELLPDMVFVRALALSVCRALKVDATAIMSSLPGAPAAHIKPTDTGLNAAFRDSGTSSHSKLTAKLLSPLGLGVAFLLLLIGGILAWPTESTTESAPQSVMPPTYSDSADQDKAMQAAAMAGAAPVSPTEPVSAASHAATSSGGVSTPGASAPALVASAKEDLDATPVGQPALLEMTASGVSWVEVFDATGTSKLRKLTAQGDVLRVSGQLPLSVVVGRADQMAVKVRGQVLDLMPLAKDNVARFEVK
jgi:cytoskeleton protein RodZ